MKKKNSWKVLLTLVAIGVGVWLIFFRGGVPDTKTGKCEVLVDRLLDDFSDDAPDAFREAFERNRPTSLKVCMLAPEEAIDCMLDEDAYDDCGNIVLGNASHFCGMAAALMCPTAFFGGSGASSSSVTKCP